MGSSGLITRCVLPSGHGVFSFRSTCPAALARQRQVHWLVRERTHGGNPRTVYAIPPVPMQQWPLSLPIPQRVFLAASPKSVMAALHFVRRVNTQIQRLGRVANRKKCLRCLTVAQLVR